MKKLLLALLAITLIVSCGEDSDDNNSSGGFNSGVPAVDPIVANATPSALTPLSSFINTLKNYRGALIDKSLAVTNETTLVTWLSTCVFATSDGCASSLYYRYWTNVVDDKINEMERRFSEVPVCVNANPTQVDFPNPMGSGNITIYLSCNDSGDDSSTPPAGVQSQNMYFGFNNNIVYLFFKTVYTNGSARAFIAEASSAGNDVKIWDISKGDSANNNSVSRVFANSATNDFSYFFAAENPSNNANVVHFFARRSGDNLFIHSQADDTAGTAGIQTPVDILTGNTTSTCRSASNVTTAGSDCSAINGQPTGFGIGDGSASALSQSNSTGVGDSQYDSDLSAILNYDLSAIATVEGQVENSN